MNAKKTLMHLTALTGFTLGAIHVINKLITLNASAERVLDTSDENYFDWKFGKIFYTKKGTGKPLLLIHDLDVASSIYEWNKVIDDLAKSHTVYAIELLGCGRSEKPELDYTNYLYVQLITDFINSIIGEKTDIIATGESSAFVIAACKANTQIIDKVIMVNPMDVNALAAAPGKYSKTLMHLIRCPIIGTLVYNMVTAKNMMEEKLVEDSFYHGECVEEKDVLSYFKAAHLDNCKGKYLLASLKGNYTSITLSYLLKDLENSIYILNGNGDESLGKISEQYKKILPSVDIIGIDETGYLPQMEKPKDFVEQVEILLNE